ncbi:MAG: V-type ATP synthase subunit D [Candidatus Hodarchaeales archaeon]
MSSASIISGINPTRMGLLELKERKKLAENGHDLLKRKLETLTSELFEIIKDYGVLEEKARISYGETIKALNKAEIASGPLVMKEVAQNYPELVSIETDTRSLMGVNVPVIKSVREVKNGFLYSLTETSGVLDESIEVFEGTLDLLLELAEKQSTITKLATEVNSTKRRVNALKNIVIPRLIATIRYISLALQEREREDFVRLKKIKARLEQQKEK